MKKKIALFLTLILVATTFLAACGKKADSLTKVTLNEVAHSIFYAPQYVAIELGYFEEEGIDLELVTGFGSPLLIQKFPAVFHILHILVFSLFCIYIHYIQFNPQFHQYFQLYL
jgi:ABC-type glycerol-3-phosphate transport system substrate-binding protein